MSNNYDAFQVPGVVSFTTGTGNLTTATLLHNGSTATICLYGAHVTSYVPANGQEVLWMSKASAFEMGKAIRGGIPICFPWFGPHATDKAKPQHGFARLSVWEVVQAGLNGNAEASVQLRLTQNEYTHKLWPHNFEALVTVSLGQSLQVALQISNTGNTAFEYSDALHTYFLVSDVDAIALEGFDGAGYYEAFGNQLLSQPTAQLYAAQENNRRYVNHSGNAAIVDKGLHRKIIANKQGSKVSVVWNPGPVTAAKMADVHDGGYKNFLCIEPANAYAGIDMITLEPGEQFTLSAAIHTLSLL
jgi:glucose-6-phosphate 1-epimerase